jgi:periplasmic divalent cation tolerance protein
VIGGGAKRDDSKATPPKAPDVIVVLVTCPNHQVGEKIGRVLVEERLAACVNIVPGLTSIYRWQGKLCRDREVLLIVKTRRTRFPGMARRIASLHPYSVPEILAPPIARGNPTYLAWVRESTTVRNPRRNGASSPILPREVAQRNDIQPTPDRRR